MKPQPLPLIAASVATATTTTVATYLALRERLHRWGATDADQARPLPGDDLIPQPNLDYTLAITIDAPPDRVWPWIVQLGQGRGGWYSYDWLENLLGLDIHSSDRILPEFQQLEPGDVIPTGAIPVPVIDVEPHHLLLLGGAPLGTVAFVLDPLRDDRTRLLFRNRAHVDRTPSGLLWFAALDPGIFVMSRKMLLTLKDRAEGGSKRARSSTPTYNRLVLRIAGRRNSPFAIVEHRGRRSGRVYRTPVEALPTEDGFVIALGHGPGCDWCRNVLAAGGCAIVHHGERYDMGDPQVIDFQTAAPLLSSFRRWIYRRTGANDFLRLRHVAQAEQVVDTVPEELELEAVA
jgi:deazaflavin-dependent oxidoreductase (nitroreductase family)